MCLGTGVPKITRCTACNKVIHEGYFVIMRKEQMYHACSDDCVVECWERYVEGE